MFRNSMITECKASLRKRQNGSKPHRGETELEVHLARVRAQVRPDLRDMKILLSQLKYESAQWAPRKSSGKSSEFADVHMSFMNVDQRSSFCIKCETA